VPSFRETLLDEVVRPAVRALPRITIGVVENYYKRHNTVDVRVLDTSGTQGTDLLEHVPVMMTNGLNHCGPFPGQRVIIDYVDGQRGTPVVIGVLQKAYHNATREATQNHVRQGTMVPRTLSTRPFKWTESGAGWDI